ncbi:MAG: hypothetical protein FH761_13555 [Firmicutes bacterium]|nr:hypothetical protein [Bacillota bacterium]
MTKKALLSITLIGLLAFGVGMGTYAWFTSQATSSNNSFATGTLALATAGEGSINIDLNTANLQPGDILTGDDTTEFASITIENDGSLNMATFGRFTVDGNLADDMIITDYKAEFFHKEESQPYRVDNFIENGVKHNDQFASNMYDWVNGNGPLDIPGTAWDEEALKPGDYFTITFRLVYDKNATAQGETANLGYEVYGTQVREGAIQALNLEGVSDEYIANYAYPYLLNQVSPE